MFSGIVEAVARLSTSDESRSSRRLCFKTRLNSGQHLAVGQSVAIDGVCLTVVEVDAQQFCVEATQETLSCTTLQALSVGERVNLETALAASGRFDGHFVSGHVDGLGTIIALEDGQRTRSLHIEASDYLMKYIAPKGSVCVNGTSLVSHTVARRSFSVHLIPHTLAATSFPDKKVGDCVNIEVDLIARYVERLLAAQMAHAK